MTLKSVAALLVVVTCGNWAATIRANATTKQTWRRA